MITNVIHAPNITATSVVQMTMHDRAEAAHSAFSDSLDECFRKYFEDRGDVKTEFADAVIIAEIGASIINDAAIAARAVAAINVVATAGADNASVAEDGAAAADSLAVETAAIMANIVKFVSASAEVLKLRCNAVTHFKESLTNILATYITSTSAVNIPSYVTVALASNAINRLTAAIACDVIAEDDVSIIAFAEVMKVASVNACANAVAAFDAANCLLDCTAENIVNPAAQIVPGAPAALFVNGLGFRYMMFIPEALS